MMQAGRRQEELNRAFDVLIALGAVLFLCPLLIVVAVLVKLEDRGAILFSHERIGLGGRRFGCLKFRTMAPDAEQRLEALLAADPQARWEWAQDHKLRRDPRITRIGKFLRTSSLDELPQLINILRGEMSLVGPRPIVAAEMARYGVHIRHYCAVKPGLTGLWQVSGRNDTTYRRRVVMDVAYVRAHGVGLDLGILFKTVPAVLLRRGSY
jgi:exopolysaccharide production protein ExoY